MKTLITTLVFLISLVGFTQTTFIFDNNFEQTLIDLGIDSDNTVNYQVLTSDIDQVTHLDLSASSHLPISDIEGIKDFTALQVLNISGIGFINSGEVDIPPYLDLSTLTALEELYFTSQGDTHNNILVHLYLTNNPNLTTLESLDVGALEFIDLEGSDVNLTNLTMNFTGDWQDICINVTDPVAAQNAQGVYASWNVTYNSQTGVLSYSDDCEKLHTASKEKINFSLYPNPASHQFHIKSTRNLDQIKLYNLQGKLIKTFHQQETYDISNLASGVYFLKLRSGKQVYTQKLIKN
ncbi:T9SS type A sorting domain-containing protein [Mesonia sp. HuA40]|uniref:T9SS type A sorting domain-containing protein n=1 Tax=Mesonia sp. HuA40 TaxID=2602761 RepID=UPI0011CA3A7E|nr:T9SS type A sorting domain-containing protein [Mesonia sp. HuA40]TXK71483.1 T9SS type A sorting domain-containing protein [Mesonia sp. HuA40]